jgi:hypothetical protein
MVVSLVKFQLNYYRVASFGFPHLVVYDLTMIQYYGK